jgi:hypothetical protein
MYKTPYFSAIVLVALVFTGCIIPGARRERAEIELQRNDSIFFIDEGDFKFQIVLPKDLMINHTPEILLKQDKNRLVISCGPTFQLIAEIRDSQGSIQPTQTGVFHCSILDNEDNSCVYARLLPDGQVFDYGLIQQTNTNETDYIFYTDELGEYTLQDVLKMRTALASIKM